jgi:hypothetical protein
MKSCFDELGIVVKITTRSKTSHREIKIETNKGDAKYAKV